MCGVGGVCECVILPTHLGGAAPCLQLLQHVVSGLLQHNFSSVLACYEWQPHPNLTHKSLLEVAIPLIVISVHTYIDIYVCTCLTC